ncbi:MAG: sulfatase-like hydrolase/transferase [Acidobacteriota bacterium]
MITLDTVRADHLGCYGSASAETPNLDRLAREGTRFDSVTAAAPLTLPAHSTLLSGVSPAHHGVHENGGQPFPAELPTLATRLHDAGYDTAAFVAAFVLDRRFGLARGFELYDDEIARGPGNATLEAERPGPAVVDRALAWLRRDRQAPFFLWVHLYDAHAPYTPPEPFKSRHAGDPYAGEIAGVDAQVGRLLESLSIAGILDHTLVAVVADHGEGLGEHGESRHGLLLYESTLRVPLLMRAPGVLAAGAKVARPVGAADLAPTLLGLLGVPSGASAPSLPGDGRDLSTALRSGQEPAPADLYAETEYPRLFGWGELRALRRGDRKLISGPRPELFDLVRDATEAHDLMTEEPRAATALETTLEQLRKQSETIVANLPAAAPDAETRARLQNLGYASGSPAHASTAASRSPQDMVQLFRRFEIAEDELARGRARDVAPVLVELCRQDPSNPAFAGALAQAWRAAGDLESAIAAYERAAELTPNDARIWSNLGAALREGGRAEDSAKALGEALRLDPNDAEAENGMGIVESLRGNGDEALGAFTRALALDPRNAVTANNLGNALRTSGRIDEAAAAYGKALELAPDYADALNGLGALDVARQRPAEGLALLERAHALDPGKQEIQLNIAVALELLGERDRAAQGYRDYLDSVAANPEFEAQRIAVRQRLKALSAAGTPHEPRR